MNVNELLHILWTKAVGTEGYDKKEWQLLEAYVNGEVNWSQVPHLFVGRVDRICEKCGGLDRWSIHRGNIV